MLLSYTISNTYILKIIYKLINLNTQTKSMELLINY